MTSDPVAMIGGGPGLRPASEFPSPVIQDVTLRDGNQALRKPWNPEQKDQVFGLLCALGVQGAEVGYPGASQMDFDGFVRLAEKAPSGMNLTALASANERDVMAGVKALSHVTKATPCLHTFIAMSPYNMERQLRKTPHEVRRMAVDAVKMAREGVGPNGHVQFSPEHFGDCLENLDWVIDTFLELMVHGADIFNLPTTVERYRPAIFAEQVRRVRAALPDAVMVSAHCHNDLGMGTATTVEGFFAGAQQLEVTLNGLGERSGNTSLYEVAVALHNNGVEVDLRFDRIQEIAIRVAELSGVAIYEKAPLIGPDCFMQRSGIHQHGAIQTFDRSKGAYRPIDPGMIGRAGDEELEFTSQSGAAAVVKLILDAGYPIEMDEARMLQPALKLVSEVRGALTIDQLVEGYNALMALKSKKDDVSQSEVDAIVRDAIGLLGKRTWGYVEVVVLAGTTTNTATVVLTRDGKQLPPQAAIGDGPVHAAYNALRAVTAFDVEIDDYSIGVIEGGSDDSPGKAIVTLTHGDLSETGEGVDTDIVVASVKAYIEALNKLLPQFCFAL